MEWILFAVCILGAVQGALLYRSRSATLTLCDAFEMMIDVVGCLERRVAELEKDHG